MNRPIASSTAAPRVIGMSVLAITGAIGRLPRLPVDPDPAPLRAALLHTSPTGIPSSTRSASQPSWSGPSKWHSSPWSSRFPLALMLALFITDYAPKRLKALARVGRRPDGGGAEHHLRAVGLLPPAAARDQPRPLAQPALWLDSRSSTSTPTRMPPCGSSRATPARRSSPVLPSR